MRIGVDIGGSKIEAALVEDKQVVARQRMATQRSDGYDSVLKRLAQLITQLLSKQGRHLTSLEGIGLGVPGTLDPQSRRMINGNSLIFRDRDLRADLAAALGWQQEIPVANDANCFALAEAHAGAGVKTEVTAKGQVCVGIILGTGVGGGVIFEGKILEGRRGSAGEVGHTLLRTGGYPCYCGRDGCAEQYLSGPALEAQMQARRYGPLLGKAFTAPDIFSIAADGDPVAIAVVNRYRRDLALFLSHIVQTYDPNLIVLGGGMSLASPIYETLRADVAQLSFSGSAPEILPNELGDSAGVIGAALL